MRLLLPVAFALLFVSAPPGSAADAIGFVYSGGSYHMDGVGVRGNATLFEGSTIQIGEAAARVQLASGAGMWLAPGSRATMSARGVRLLAGLGLFDAPPEYWLEARAVRVASSEPHTTVRLALDETGGAVVTPLKGAVEVTNSRGVRVGELAQGSAVRFAGRGVAPSTVEVSGCLYANGDHFTLTDTVTGVPLRLRGRGLEREVGHVINVSGVGGLAAGDARDVTVTTVRRLARVLCGAPGTAAGNAALLALAKSSETAGQLQAAGPRLNLVIVEGEGAINNIRQRTAREPIVEVQDENHRPVAGALVLFALPRNGASGAFSDGTTTLRVTTDAQGHATARGLKPNNTAGQFEIAVSASFAGMTASIVVRQINSVTGASPGAAAKNAGKTAGQQAETTVGVGAGTGGATAGAGGATAGVGVGAKVAIIGGITASFVTGGLAAAGVFRGEAEPAVSR